MKRGASPSHTTLSLGVLCLLSQHSELLTQGQPPSHHLSFVLATPVLTEVALSCTQPLKQNSLPRVFVYYLMGKRILSESSDAITQNVISPLGFEYTEIKQLLGGMKTTGETVPSTLACQVGKLRSSSITMGI